jgi:hypothetical protein
VISVDSPHPISGSLSFSVGSPSASVASPDTAAASTLAHGCCASCGSPPGSRRHPPDVGHPGTVAARTLARFSSLAGGLLALVAVAGLVLGWRILGSWPALVGTTYGLVLVAKTTLVALVVAAHRDRERVQEVVDDDLDEEHVVATPRQLGVEGQHLGVRRRRGLTERVHVDSGPGADVEAGDVRGRPEVGSQARDAAVRRTQPQAEPPVVTGGDLTLDRCFDATRASSSGPARWIRTSSVSSSAPLTTRGGRGARAVRRCA